MAVLTTVAVVETEAQKAVADEPHWEKQQYAKKDVQGIHWKWEKQIGRREIRDAERLQTSSHKSPILIH